MRVISGKYKPDYEKTKRYIFILILFLIIISETSLRYSTSSNVLLIIYFLTPFIFITLIGFFFGRSKILDLNHAKILNLFLFYIAVPALIINFVAQSEIGQIDLKQIISYFLMQSTCGIFTFLLASKYFKRPIPESIIWALTVALSNHVTLLLPITQIYFNDDVITQVASIILMDGVILLSLIAFFLELATKKNVQPIIFIRNIILNPMILSILIGVFLFAFNFKPIEFSK